MSAAEDAARTVLDELFNPWGDLRMSAQAVKGQDSIEKVVVEVPSELMGADFSGLRTLRLSPEKNAVAVERVLKEAIEDTAYHFESDEWEIWGRSVMALGVVLETNPPLTAEMEDTIFELAVAYYDPYGIPSFVDSFRLSPGFTWRGTATIPFARQWDDGKEYLAAVRGTVDPAAWDALVEAWEGTVDELVEACRLIER